MKSNEYYCPYCKRTITASNTEDVESGEHEDYIFLHDEGVEHDNDFDFSEMH